MKLRKALDKAKKERQDVEASLDVDEPPIQESVQEKEKADWSCPVYSESKTVKLDFDELLENRCICISPEACELNSYKILRTQIQQRTKEKGWNTVMITSVGAGEGKTVTSINLAITFAREFHQTVLLVDGDLKHQSIHNFLGYSSNTGLVDYLVEDKSLADLIIWPSIEKMTVISGGRTVQDSTELLNSPRMKALVDEMKNRYEDRYILFDVPPLLGGADAITFAPLVDCIIIVIEAGKTSMADIKKALDLIPEEKFLGFVLNRQPAS